MFQSLEMKHPKFYQVFRFFVVIAASIFYAWNLRCFAKTAGLFPGGFSGLSLLLQEIGLVFFGISIPYTLLNVLLNLFPTYIAYKYIGKRFTLYSIVVIVLSSIFVDILPPYMFTDDILLLRVRRYFKRLCHQSVLKCRNDNRRNGLYQHFLCT